MLLLELDTLDSETTFWHFGNHQTGEQEIEDGVGLLEVVRWIENFFAQFTDKPFNLKNIWKPKETVS